jgi:pSer/pThr/pTyr-binding forkhead associated (FHA) protein
MDVKLIVEKGARVGQIFKLRSHDTVVGRRRGCGLRIPSETVSRRHCRLTFRDDYLTVEDLASVNGTLVNGRLIAKPTIVHPGDRLTIGSLTFSVQYQLTPKALDKLLGEEQKNMEMLPTFDRNDSSLPVPMSEVKEPSVEKETPKQPAAEDEATTPPPKKAKSAATKKMKPEDVPDASVIFEGQSWQLPSGEDIRDILADLEKE